MVTCMRDNNSGLSLVELIVSMAVLAVASTAIMAFLNTGLRNYNRGNEEASIQYEAQLATNQIIEMLIDANKGVTYSLNGYATTDYKLADDPTVDPTKKFFRIYNSDGYIELEWVKADRKIYYTEYEKNPGDTTPTVKTVDRVLLAESVKSMSVELTDADKNGKVRLKFTFQKAENGKEYTINQYVTMRNAINNSDFSINKPIGEVYVAE